MTLESTINQRRNELRREEAQERLALDRQMVSDMDRWPCWPWLPLKHRTKEIMTLGGLGVLFAYDRTRKPHYKVYLTCMIGINDRNLDDLPTEEYEDLESMLADWTVD